LDIAARQVSVGRQADYFSDKNIAGGSTLNPTIFMAYGMVFGISDHWVMLPSVALNWALPSIPVFNPTAMFYYNNRIGLGVATRNLTFAAAIFQAKIVKNLSVGFSYAYTTNLARHVAPNTYEIMVGVAPMGMSERQRGRHSVAKCPALDF
jgi:hypothetical protein